MFCGSCDDMQTIIGGFNVHSLVEEEKKETDKKKKILQTSNQSRHFLFFYSMTISQ